MVEQGNWGLVKILTGEFKGTIGVYDDDEGDKAVVYPSRTPWQGPWLEMDHKDLEPVERD